MLGPIRFGIIVLFLLAVRTLAFGYEKDVHFSLTFATCLAAGYRFDEALQIASADERIDENDTTAAFSRARPNTVTSRNSPSRTRPDGMTLPMRFSEVDFHCPILGLRLTWPPMRWRIAR